MCGWLSEASSCASRSEALRAAPGRSRTAAGSTLIATSRSEPRVPRAVHLAHPARAERARGSRRARAACRRTSAHLLAPPPSSFQLGEPVEDQWGCCDRARRPMRRHEKALAVGRDVVGSDPVAARNAPRKGARLAGRRLAPEADGNGHPAVAPAVRRARLPRADQTGLARRLRWRLVHSRPPDGERLDVDLASGPELVRGVGQPASVRARISRPS